VTSPRTRGGATSFESRTFLPTTVSVGDASEVAVTCDDNLLDEFVVDVIDGALVLRQADPLVSLDTRVDCSADVELPTLEGVINGASGPMTLAGDFGDLREVRVSGSGALSSTGTLDGLGGADIATITVSGSGSLGTEGFVVNEVDLTLSASGHAVLTATTLATITVSGSGSATVHGDPAICDIDDSGGSGSAECVQ